jgi:hypothetical protein
LKSGRKKVKPAREKTMKDGKLAWKDQVLKLEMDDKPVVKQEAEEMEDDDLTASEGEFEALPAGPIATGFLIPSVKQEDNEPDDDDDTVDEDEDEVIPLTYALAPASSSTHEPSSGVEHIEEELDPPSSSVSPPPGSGPSAINWGDLRGTMGQRRGNNGRTLLPGQSDDEDGSDAIVSLPLVVSGTAMRMKTFVASSKGKDRARKEEDQMAHVSTC